LTGTLALCLSDLPFDASPSDLALAARMHELGRLSGPAADPAGTAERGAAMLQDAGFPPTVVRAVLHLHERWDGTGGPHGLSASRIPASSQLLAVADSLDHYCAAWLQAGTRIEDAIDRAIGLVVAQQGSLFSPVVIGVVMRERPALAAVLGEARTESGARAASA
jgi:putative two-component system response regulator